MGLAGLLLCAFLGYVEAEVPDDPRAESSARSDVLARSPGRRFRFGSYVSVQVNVDEFGQNIVGDAANEPSIAVVTVDRRSLVIAWRHFETITSNFRQAGYGYSRDGGRSWIHPGVLTEGTFRSDPVLVSHPDGFVYLQSLKGNFLSDVFASVDGGIEWLEPVPALGGDKPWMAIDTTGGPGNHNLYLIWQDLFNCCGLRTFTRAQGGSLQFEPPSLVPAHPTFGTLTVGPDGTVYAVGADSTADHDFSQFVVSRSTDAGTGATPPEFGTVFVEMGGAMAVGGGPNPQGLIGQANIVVDHSDGPSRGNVYVLSAVRPPGPDPMEVHFIRSTDGGRTWSAPLRVNDDLPGSQAWQWMAAVAVAPDGRLDAIWNDTRHTRQTNLSQLFYAYSYDQGHTWSKNVAVSPVFDSHIGWPNQNKIGDYYDLVSDIHGADVAYAATFNGEQDVYYIRLFPDCNGNGESDRADLDSGRSTDLDGNRIPDECEGRGRAIQMR